MLLMLMLVREKLNFKFINPKCKVYRWLLGVLSAGSCVSNYQNWLGRLKQGKTKGDKKKNYTTKQNKDFNYDLNLEWIN